MGVRYVITKFSRIDSLPNFLTHGVAAGARKLRYKKLYRERGRERGNPLWALTIVRTLLP